VPNFAAAVITERGNPPGRPHLTAEQLGAAGRRVTVFGRAVRRGRLAKGVTVRDLAAAAGVPRSTVNGWEIGALPPPEGRAVLVAVAHACGLDAERLAAVADMERTESGYLRLPIDTARVIAQSAEGDYPNLAALWAVLDGKEDALLSPG
jgi:transcriptional regulator with XRE-family HTH domain